MARIFTLKNLRWLMIAILLISIIPLLWISFYSFPLADDFSFTATPRHVWNETHSLWAVGKAVVATVADHYMHWQGSYFSTILGTLQPALLGEGFYFLTTWLLLAACIVGTFALVRSIFRHVLKQADHVLADITACVILMLFIQWVPSPVQSFFWWDGAAVYIGIHMLLMLAMALLIACLVKDSCSPLRLILMLVTVLLIGGGNYITGLLQCELFTLAVLYAFAQKKQVRIHVLLIALASIAGLLINVLAPGNFYRQATYTGMPLFESLGASFAMAFTHCKIWFVRILLALVFLSPFFWQIPVQNVCKKAWLLPVLIVLGFCIQASLYEPTYFAIGIPGEQRIDNVRFYTFILNCMLWLFVGVQQVKWRLEKKRETPHQTAPARWLRTFALVTAVVVALTGVLLVYEFKCNSATFSSLSALASLLKGEAQEYRRVSYERLSILKTDEPNVLVPAHKEIPYVLRWADITTDPAYWVNTLLAEYYQKESVAVAP